MSAFFSPRAKLPIHIVEIIIIHAVLGCAGARMFLPNTPRTRTSFMALGFSAKSLIFIGYQLLTEHVQRFKRWQSLKAYVILNALEIVFWAAVVYFGISNGTQACAGISCTLGIIVTALGACMSLLSAHAAVISWLDFRFFKQTGLHRGAGHGGATRIRANSDPESMEHAMRPVPYYNTEYVSQVSVQK